MITEQQQENACLYVAGALTPDEAARFEAELKASAELREFTDSLRKVPSALALATPAQEPPAHLKNKILAALPDKKIVRPDFQPQPRPIFLEWLPWAAAACLAVTTVIYHQQVTALRGQQADKDKLLASAQAELAEWKSKNALSQVKIAQLNSLIENSPKAAAVSMWDQQKQEGMLVVQDLPPASADQDYQLWVIGPQQGAVDAGVFKVDEKGNAHISFKPKSPVANPGQFAVTLEKKGGVPKAQGKAVLAGSWM